MTTPIQPAGDDNKIPEEEKKAQTEVPNVVEIAVAEAFQKLKIQPPPRIGHSSIFKKLQSKSDYDFGLTKDPISLQELVKKKNPQSILDLGCGPGSVLKGLMEAFPHIKAIGIDARPSACLDNDHFILGNAERLRSIEGIDPVDLIVSVGTFRHFLDPKEALIQAYEKLNHNGWLIIDQIHLPGIEKAASRLIPYLKQQGYNVFAERTGPGAKWDYFAIQKTNPFLQLPIYYDPKKPLHFNSAHYVCEDLECDPEENSLSLREYLDLG